MSEIPNIRQRIVAVQKEVSYVQKDAEVKTGGSSSYKAVSHDNLIAQIRPSMIKHGITVEPAQTRGKMEYRVINGKEQAISDVTETVHEDGPVMINRKRNADESDDLQEVGNKKTEKTTQTSKIFRQTGMYDAWYEFKFVNVDDPNDFIVVPINAHAYGNDDKNPNKALSSAKKAAILALFLIESGVEEESRNYIPETLDADQIAIVEDLAKESKADIPRMLKHYAVSTIAEIDVEYYDDVVRQLTAKIKHQKDAKKAKDKAAKEASKAPKDENN